LGLVELGQLNQLQVHFAYGRKIVFDDLNIHRRHLLDTLQYVEPAASAIALEGVSGVSHQLQLAQNKLRDHHDAIKEAGLRDVGDATVNDHAGIENLGAAPALLLRTKDAAKSRKIEQVAFVGADDQANIRHQQHYEQLKEMLSAPWFDAVAENKTEKIGAENAENAANHGPNQALEADDAQARLEQHHGNADGATCSGRCPAFQPERTQHEARYRNNENEDETDK